ncbi:SEC61A [Mytilus coruscus]|uniref:SEC61A n=1 Tax=Mytilus coruscus TaxID=42192 RepID=A0A6J8D265_MYTCO|nr:SEC61A [Mytilus coruscus]
MFDQFVLVEKADLVFFNIEVNKEFLNETTFDNIHENGILRWILVSNLKTDVLSYPVDLDGITLQLTKSAERTIDVFVNETVYIKDHNPLNYTICILSLYKTLFDQILDKNTCDWKFCHRYFEGQYWKHLMYNILGSWLGYDFECFNTFCSDIECADIVPKGIVNVVIDLFIFLLCINLPLFYLFLPKRQHISQNHAMHYYKGDSPYSFARLFLHLNTNSQTVYNDKKCKTFSNWLRVLMKDSTILNPEAKVLSFFYFVLFGVFLLQKLYLRTAIADFDKYIDIYHPSYLSFDAEWDNKFHIALDTVLFTCSFMSLFPALLV